MRLFVAIEVNEALRSLAREACAALAREGLTGRFESPEKLHVTLAFLGSVHGDRLGEVVTTFQACWQAEPFRLEFDRLGAFPNLHRPRVIWMGSSYLNPSFEACSRQVRAAFTGLGFSFEHDPQPHVSICRPKGGRLASLPPLGDAANVQVQGLALFQSIPAGPTTRYEAIARTPEGGRT